MSGSVEVTFMKSDENATTDPAAPPYTATLNEAGTETDIEVTVTAQDGTTTETYTITVLAGDRHPGLCCQEGRRGCFGVRGIDRRGHRDLLGGAGDPAGRAAHTVTVIQWSRATA